MELALIFGKFTRAKFREVPKFTMATPLQGEFFAVAKTREIQTKHQQLTELTERQKSQVLKILFEELIPKAGSSESKVFYLKMKGDLQRCRWRWCWAADFWLDSFGHGLNMVGVRVWLQELGLVVWLNKIAWRWWLIILVLEDQSFMRPFLDWNPRTFSCNNSAGLVFMSKFLLVAIADTNLVAGMRSLCFDPRYYQLLQQAFSTAAKGDYHRYLSEFATGENHSKCAQEAWWFMILAREMSSEHCSPWLYSLCIFGRFIPLTHSEF